MGLRTPADRKAGKPGAGLIPYALRHTCASLMLRRGMSVVEVAQQLGHSPQMTLSTYAHVIAELDPADRRPADALIREARCPQDIPTSEVGS